VPIITVLKTKKDRSTRTKVIAGNICFTDDRQQWRE